MEDHKHRKKQTMKVAIFALSSVVLIFTLSVIFANQKVQEFKDGQASVGSFMDKRAIVNIGGNNIIASVADTKASRTKGLSGVEYMGPREGKLFVFEEEDFHSFWMKDMNFSIDIIWINELGTVVDIKENISPSTYPDSFVPRSPALSVLEVNSGYVKEQGVKVGDQVIWTELK